MAAAGQPSSPPAWAPQVPPGHLAPAQPHFVLQPDKESGGYRCKTAGFTAIIHDDGSVDFRSHRKVELLPFPLNFKPLALPSGTPDLVGELHRVLQGEPARKPGRMEGAAPPLYPAYARDILELCSSPQSRCFFDQRGQIMVANASGPLDLGEEVMRMLGEDPAKFEKARFLSATTGLRTRMAERKRKSELQRALEDMPAMLNRIWRTPMLTREERLAIVRSLLPEIDDTAPGAESARAQIQAFLDKREAESTPPPMR